jgi:hypothetical protein
MQHWKLENDEKITAGDTLMNGRYTIEANVGIGGQGKIYLVVDNKSIVK